MVVRKLFLDLEQPCTEVWPYSGCPGSVACHLLFSTSYVYPDIAVGGGTILKKTYKKLMLVFVNEVFSQSSEMVTRW